MNTTEYKLFLDDTRRPYEVTWLPEVRNKGREWTIARSYKEFCRLIDERGIPSEVSFDHDLGYDMEDKVEYTGVHCLKYLVLACNRLNKPFPKTYVHSQNPIGRDRIVNLIESYLEYGI